MDNYDTELYLARMEKMELADWRKSRRKGLQAVDKLRLFYLAQYLAKKEYHERN